MDVQKDPIACNAWSSPQPEAPAFTPFFTSNASQNW